MDICWCDLKSSHVAYQKSCIDHHNVHSRSLIGDVGMSILYPKIKTVNSECDLEDPRQTVLVDTLFMHMR